MGFFARFYGHFFALRRAATFLRPRWPTVVGRRGLPCCAAVFLKSIWIHTSFSISRPAPPPPDVSVQGRPWSLRALCLLQLWRLVMMAGRDSGSAARRRRGACDVRRSTGTEASVSRGAVAGRAVAGWRGRGGSGWHCRRLPPPAVARREEGGGGEEARGAGGLGAR